MLKMRILKIPKIRVEIGPLSCYASALTTWPPWLLDNELTDKKHLRKMTGTSWLKNMN